jgi:uncharacterized delta-60 repeat protein
VAVGTTSTPDLVADGYAMARYDASGHLDWKVKDNGAPIFNPVVAADEAGRFVVAGTAYSRCCGSMFLSRRDAAGGLDTTFGQNGVVFFHVSADSFDQAYGLAVDRRGRIVVVGCSNASGSSDFAAIRFDTTGHADRSFGTHGHVLTELGAEQPSIDGAIAVAIDDQGRIVVAGNSYGAGSHDFALVRYQEDGVLDATFGKGGKVLTDFASFITGSDDRGSYDVAFGMALDNSGRIVVGGYSDALATPSFALARYTPDGMLDLSFGLGGLVLTSFGVGSSDEAYAVTIDGAGGLVLAGRSNARGTSDFALARYGADGRLDRTFGNAGMVVTDFSGAGSDDGAYGLAVDKAGRLVAAGYSGTGGTYDFALARYESQTPSAESAPSQAAGATLWRP